MDVVRNTEHTDKENINVETDILSAHLTPHLLLHYLVGTFSICLSNDSLTDTVQIVRSVLRHERSRVLKIFSVILSGVK